MKIALVYDRVNKIGGAERILTALNELYPEAPLYTLVYDKKRAAWAQGFKIHTSFLQKIPFARVFHEFFPILPIFAFEQFDFKRFDIVISVTSTEAKAIITGPQTLHMSYILTPTRYLWSHYWDYFQNKFLRILSLPAISIVRIWDYFVSSRPDVLIAISKESARRISKYYRRSSKVIYPPVDIKKFKVESLKLKDKEDYFLIVSRLVDYKRIDIAIEACNKLKLPLKIVGTGLARKKLESLAGPTVTFLGNLTDVDLTHYYQNCGALLTPQEEDFGIVAVEALAHGKPVIAYGAGGIKEIIIKGKSGEFFYPQTKEALIAALEKFAKKTYSSHFCTREAERFSKEHFKQEFDLYIKEEWFRFNRDKKI